MIALGIGSSPINHVEEDLKKAASNGLACLLKIIALYTVHIVLDEPMEHHGRSHQL
jgi:hypothetical protein